MEEVCERENLKEALQVKANKGSSGVDGMTVVALSDYLRRKCCKQERGGTFVRR
jgi:RNA-directed DNA polymerase